MAINLLDELQPELRPSDPAGTRLRGLAVAAGCFAGAFVLAGFSEQWGLTQIVILLLLSIIVRRRLVWLALAGAVLGYAVVAIAPGNTVRVDALAAIHAPRLPFFQAGIYSLASTGSFVLKTFATKLYAPIIALCAGYLAGQGRHLRNRFKWLMGVMGAGYTFIAISMFPVELLSGNLELRHYTIPTFILMICLASIGYIFACQN